jgi:hypothetical protein
LPAQRIGSGAWASATFRPELEVVILGAAAEAHQTLEKGMVAADGQLVGEWIWDGGLLTHKITFVTRGDRVFMLKTFSGKNGDSATTEQELEVVAPNNYRDPKAKTTWMKINDKGELEFHDQNGRFDAARPLKKAG